MDNETRSTILSKAVENLRPQSKWLIHYNSAGHEVEWLDDVQLEPTKLELDEEIARLQSEYDNNEYQRQRAKAYPSITEQLDLLYHGGIDAWKAEITAVKEEFPK